ncbi:hypothetical protein BHE74_00032108 [Ensete ventricosum]|nr:hypothetical protein GW17_00047485 [Ensete ventricosum]RWW60857.1 hypothetical protein BHE74_00032108 [Ensete ventricosum]
MVVVDVHRCWFKRRSRLGSSGHQCYWRQMLEEAREGGRGEISGSDFVRREGSRRLNDRGGSGYDYVDGEVYNKVRESDRFAPKTTDSRWPCRAPLSKPKENFGQAAVEEEDATWLPWRWQRCSEGSRATGAISDELGWKNTAKRGQ